MASHIEEKLKNRSAHILIVNSYHSSQTSLLKALHRLGFMHIQVCRSQADLEERLRWTRVDWVLIAFSDQNSMSSMRLLRDFYTKEQPKIRFSFIVREKESLLLPEAFQNGLLNWFPLNRLLEFNTALEELTQFLDLTYDCFLKGRHEAYVAADSLRRHLLETHNTQELIRLEGSMVEAFPNDVYNLFRHAKAHFIAGAYAKGRELLEELQIADPAFPKNLLQEIWEAFPDAGGQDNKNKANLVDLRNVMIIERDEAERSVLRQALRHLGIRDPLYYSNYEEAWKALRKGLPVDLMIAEWVSRPQELNATQFFQRLRAQEDTAFLPVCILGSRLSGEEAQLAADLNILQIIPKPLREDQTAMSLAFALEQYRRPTERRGIEQKIIQALHEGHKTFAYHLRKVYINHPAIAVSRKYFVEAIFHYQHKNFTKAKNHLVKGLELSAQSREIRGVRINVDKMFLLAQCMLQLANRQAALLVLEKASILSPHNIRLHLAMMETYLDLGQLREAEIAYRKAERIDADHIQVLLARARLKLSEDETGESASLLRKDEEIEDVISQLNNQAVSLIQKDQIPKAIEVYSSALQLFGKSTHPHLGVLYYNLALAHLRLGDRETAQRYLGKARHHPTSRIYQKASSLLDRIYANPTFALAAKPEPSTTQGLVHAQWRIATAKPTVALLGLYRPGPTDATMAS